jgi:hypothetical protein
MSNRFSRFATIAGVSALFGSWLLLAEIPGNKSVAEVPFDFRVQDRTLPAGCYEVQKMNSGSVIQIRNRATQEAVVVLAPATHMGKEGGPMLVFNGYDDHYFLSQIWFASDAYGHMLGKGSFEKELTHTAKTPAVLSYVHLR